ncbi:LptF/LptG family permease [Porifericola rhodea]|uniref:LptF/LptG family permease n=1 Tax=Porifericola rhodea TaxID=930972 RepID=UPI002665353B|nr:LptF/LptG family permease [Porifericola rhodea]WKN30460.1 LptF/LptG family permease [Porifericola rhodea]
MKILDLYILKKFLGTFFFVVLLLVSIVSVIDYTEKNDDFLEHQLEGAQILSYYVNFIPYVASLITPITVFIAVVFVTSKLAGNTEIIAILSSGISFRRMLLPYMIGAMFIAAVSFLLNGWVIPNANKERIAFEIKYVKSPFYYDERNIHMKISPQAYAYMESYNNNADVGYRFTLEKIEGNQMLEKISARRIEWDSTTSKWRLKQWKRHTFDGMQESIDSGNEMDTTLNIHPKDFGSTYGMYETLTLSELNRHISLLRERGANDIPLYQVEKYIRYMSPFTAIILTFIGVIMSARKSRGGSGFQIAMGFGIAFLFIIFFIFARSIAEANTMNPIVAVWIPNIIFSFIGLALYKFVPR